MVGFITGKPAEYNDPLSLLHKTQGREVTRVESAGVIKVEFNISHKNIDNFGFELW